MTICTEHRTQLFGKIIEGEMLMSPAGEMVRETWDEIPRFYRDVDIDAFIVMPNHMHGIIVLPSTPADLYPEPIPSTGTLVGATPCGCPSGPHESSSPTPPFDEGISIGDAPGSGGPSGGQGQPQGIAPTEDVQESQPRLSLPDVVHRFKTLTTFRYGEGVQAEGWPRYRGRLWQRNYYERVVRNEQELAKFRSYIDANPARWFEDPYRG